jgi:bifunctional DNA-binding transcriptional regulator/antitoxin component of YhaV-PrlF toxin-antitoxin module
MTELYRMRIADRRQVTLPQRLLDRLGIAVGDEIAVEMSENAQRVIGYKGIETSLLTPEIQRMLAEREKGPFKPTTVQEVMRLASGGAKPKKVSASMAAKRAKPSASAEAAEFDEHASFQNQQTKSSEMVG